MDLSQIRGDGSYRVREVLRIVFFLRRRHLDMAEAATAALYRILDALPPQTFSLFAAGSGDWVELNDEAIRAAIHTRLLGAEQTINGAVDLSSDDDNRSAYLLSYSGYALDQPVLADHAGRIELSVARSELPKLGDRLEQLADELASTLDFTHGYIDLALIGSQATRQALAKRYRAIDIASVGATSKKLGDKAAGVYWINYFKGRLVDAVGGAAALAAALPADATVETLAGGAVKVRLGAQATHGDLNRREGLEGRQALARLLAGHDLFHIPTRPIYFEDDDDGEDIDLQVAWHSRFLETE